MPHIFALLIAWIASPSFWFLPTAIFVLWAWFAHVRAGDRVAASEFDFLTRPYERGVGHFRSGLPRALCPPIVAEDPAPAGFHARLYWAMTPHAADQDHQNRLVANPWSWPVLDFAIRVALVYPVFFALVAWGFQAPTDLGGTALFPDDAPIWLRWAAICAIALLILARILASANRQGVFEKLADWLWVVAFAGAGAGAVAFAGAGAFGAGAGAFAVAVAGALAVAVAFAGAVAGAGALAVAGAGAVALAFGAVALTVAGAFVVAGAILWAARHPIGTSGGRWDFGVPAYLAVIASGLVAISYALRFYEADAVAIATFFVLLPLANAVFDWLSYGTTIWLLNFGWSRRKLNWFWPFLTGLLDLIAALFFFFALSLTLLVLLHAANSVSGQSFFDPALLLARIEQDHWQVLWVIAMIASTFLPTFLHLCLAAFSLLTAAPVARWQDYIRESDETAYKARAIRARLLFPVEATILTMLPAIAIIGLGWTLWEYGGGLVDIYARLLGHCAEALGILPAPPTIVDL